MEPGQREAPARDEKRGLNQDLSPFWIRAKAGLFLLLGGAAFVLLLVEAPSVRVGFYLIVAIWSFCRCYYFAFYVIERYLDPEFRFSGLLSMLRYLLGRRSK